MKVEQRGIEAVTLKVKRAINHLGFLYGEMAAWDAAHPWKLVPEVHDNGRKHFYRLFLLTPVPVEWAVILGEAIHDLRSAMDQCVYWLTIDWSRRVLDGTSFPAYTKRAPFYQTHRRTGDWTKTSGMFKIRGVGPGPQAFIEALQPYPQRRFEVCFAIRAVNDLWNQDKHRLGHLWGMRFDADEVGPNDPVAAAECILMLDKRVMQHSAIPLKIVCSNPYPNLKMSGTIGAGLAFRLAQRRKGGNHNLWDVGMLVSDVIYKLLGALGRQADPVNRLVWSAHGDRPGRPAHRDTPQLPDLSSWGS